MDKERIMAIVRAIKALDDVQKELAAVQEDIGTIWDEAQEYASSMPEDLQGSAKHAAAEEVAGILEEAEGDLENIWDEIGDVMEKLEEAKRG